MCHTFCQLAGALAEEGSSLGQIVVKVTEVLKEIGKFGLFVFIQIESQQRHWDTFPNTLCPCVYSRNAGGESVPMQCPRLPANFWPATRKHGARTGLGTMLTHFCFPVLASEPMFLNPGPQPPPPTLHVSDSSLLQHTRFKWWTPHQASAEAW